jgi:hypothetical protein
MLHDDVTSCHAGFILEGGGCGDGCAPMLMAAQQPRAARRKGSTEALSTRRKARCAYNSDQSPCLDPAWQCSTEKQHVARHAVGMSGWTSCRQGRAGACTPITQHHDHHYDTIEAQCSARSPDSDAVSQEGGGGRKPGGTTGCIPGVPPALPCWHQRDVVGAAVADQHLRARALSSPRRQ